MVEGHRDCLPHAHIHVPLVGVLDGADVAAFAAPGAIVGDDVSRVFSDLHLEVAHESLDLQDVRVRYYFDIRVAGDVDHLWAFDADGAVQRGEGLVQLGHVTADAFTLFNKIHLEPHVRKVKSGTDSRDSAA